jgi:hypothetical protein
MLNFVLPAHPRQVSLIECTMSRTFPTRSPSQSNDFREKAEARWLLGNSSTKVLFGHPRGPSTFVPHAAAPASLVIFTTAVSTRSES